MELYISFDCETVGGSTAKNWMPNIGFVAATVDGTICGELSVNMTQPPFTESDPDTLAWFKSLSNGCESAKKSNGTIPILAAIPARTSSFSLDDALVQY